MFLLLVALLFVALSGLAWRVSKDVAHQVPTEPAEDGLVRELTRLDPFSFFVIDGVEWGADHVVVGATGTYAVRIGQTSIDGRYRKDVRKVRRAVRRVKEGTGVARVHTTVHGILCLPGRQFRPRTKRQVKVVPWSMVAQALVERQRSVTPHQAQRVVESLGVMETPEFRY
jgi:hypothetical protein